MKFWRYMCNGRLASVVLLASPVWAQSVAGRTLKICVDSSESIQIKQSAEKILASVGSSALLAVLATNGVSVVDTEKLASEPIESRAYHHLILIGLPNDPLIQQAWQREASAEDGGFYVFGFGHLRGTVGYIESGRNPFLHSAAIRTAPYEAEVVTITGSSPAGVALAVDAFLAGIVNGVVAAPGWTRLKTTILDRDPLMLPLDTPTEAPFAVGTARRIGLTQAAESEYCDVLQDTGLTPKQIWRVKYLQPRAWDQSEPLGTSSPMEFMSGLHRRAIGNTLWIGRFTNVAEAEAAAAMIAEAAHLNRRGAAWSGDGPSGDSIALPRATGPGSAIFLVLWTSGNSVLISTVPQLTPESWKATATN